ncbi:hypothetical protein A2311_00470 [candidate division WOR-1 bacterium RIFOXYB2_FULL_48_7]|uniref:FAD/NAD(P)-binding domain-containing protein n=1 Tax=candidate division WOR-1 bacterium RIFOXYB2_FULL_48_7 TaxID=1802583 RepID=A0A1F4TTM2_UNCSA|nr:MAG: hypothetical protein A2311_00470 [candidate division WOR-1 bacterium RIFOXYB2_FULL_48_7]
MPQDALRDIVIVGAGPAGITAAVYAARKRLNFSVVSAHIGGQAAWSGEIDNYPGFQLISGPELAVKFREQLDKYSIDMRERVEVTRIERDGQNFKLYLSAGEPLMTKTVIIASGKKPRSLNVPGEKKYLNKGVAYCATCDGPLFAGKDVAIVGGGNSALDAALQMVRLAKQVYLINDQPACTGDQVMIDNLNKVGNIAYFHQAKVLEIIGQQFVQAIKLEHEGQIKELPVAGVFIEIGLIPNAGFIDFVTKNQVGEIMIDCSAHTQVPGIFAAGDVTSVPDKQIVIAAGDGAKATLSAFRYLSTH